MDLGQTVPCADHQGERRADTLRTGSHHKPTHGARSAVGLEAFRNLLRKTVRLGVVRFEQRKIGRLRLGCTPMGYTFHARSQEKRHDMPDFKTPECRVQASSKTTERKMAAMRRPLMMIPAAMVISTGTASQTI